jgi:hypothetical protein
MVKLKNNKKNKNKNLKVPKSKINSDASTRMY